MDAEAPGAGTHGGAPPPSLLRRARVGAVLFLLFAAAVLALRLRASPELRIRPLAETFGAIAMAGLYASPALLAVMSRRRRPVLLMVAGVLGLALVLTSMSITPLLIIPSILLLTAANRSQQQFRPRAHGAIIVLVALGLSVGAFVAVLSWSTPACWSYTVDAKGQRIYRSVPTRDDGNARGLLDAPGRPSGGGCTSAAPTVAGALASLGLTTLSLAGAWVLSKPKTRDSEPVPC